MSAPSDICKYPRTRHLEGSRLQPGDEDLDQMRLADLSGCHLVVEEKVDGANCALSFSPDGELLLQSRGHYLTGGPRERQFAPFKAWAAAHAEAFLDVLEDRYVVYGEWMWAKHTVFYDRLPHLFLEFDVLDRESGEFLSTPARRRLLSPLPLVSVPVLHEGPLAGRKALLDLLSHSLFKSPGWRESLADAAAEAGLDPQVVAAQTDGSSIAEGLYVKHEEGDRVVGRYKWVRADFLQAILDSGSHWASRPIVTNRLADGVDLYAQGAAR